MMLLKPKTRKAIALTLLGLFLQELFLPTAAYALTSGPSQPEFNRFVPAGSSEMVNLFTGDFTYNIPLMNVGGYPLNLAYTGDAGMDTEASWVGLGWSLNPGSMTRSMRGLPDDFQGDEVTQTRSMNPLFQTTERKGQEFYGNYPDVSIGVNVEALEDLTLGPSVSGGANFGLTLAYQRSENNYTGSGVDLQYDWSVNLNAGASGGASYEKDDVSIGFSAGSSYAWGFGNGKSFGTSGITRNPTQSFGYQNFAGASVSLTEDGGNRGGSGANHSWGSSNAISSAYSSRNGLAQSAVANSKNSGFGVSASVSQEMAGQDVDLHSWNGSRGFGISRSTAGNSIISYGTTTHIPTAPYNRVGVGMKTTARNGKIDLATGNSEYAIQDRTLYQDVKTPVSEQVPAYGYLYAEKVEEDDLAFALMDLNREQGTDHLAATMPNLSIANHTKDQFAAHAQGMSSVFRAQRSEVAQSFEPTRQVIKLITHSYNKYGKIQPLTSGLDFLDQGISYLTSQFRLADQDLTGFGVDLTNINRGTWTFDKKNFTENRLSFQQQQSAKHEPAYFAGAGEIVPFDPTFYDGYAGENVALLIPWQNLTANPKTAQITLNNKLGYLDETTGLHSLTNLPTNNVDENRKSRNQVFQQLTAEEAALFGLSNTIENHTPYDPLDPSQPVSSSSEPRQTAERKGHHISETSVLQPNGSRYVYGIPVYNHAHKEVTFNASGLDKSLCQRGVLYTENVDNSTANTNGKNHLYSARELPPFAHSYLLTAVLSSDYVDLSGDGPSEDDYGNYTKFNYSKVHDDYAWRIPYSAGSTSETDYPVAAYNPGYFCDPDDDRGMYTYGEKEIWYPHSIETKDFIAEFILEDREDGYGVVDENGELDASKPLKRLSRIDLYNKEDRANNTNPVPLQSVHFEYDYSLCAGVPNNVNGGGKLTLKKLWVSNGSSVKGFLTPYEFSYGNNYDYDTRAVDGWGGYKPNDCLLPNEEFPFVEQNQTLADTYASAWVLDQIDLPTGGKIELEYEADDYGHVQNKRASRLFQIAGFGMTADFDPLAASPNLFLNAFTPQNYLFFPLEEAISSGTTTEARDQVFEDYLEELSHIYFRCKVDLTGKDEHEYVPGYAEFEDYGVVGTAAPYNYGYVKLKGVSLLDPEAKPEDLPYWSWARLPGQGAAVGSANPIAKAAWQFTRLNLVDKIFPELDCNDAQADATSDFQDAYYNGLATGAQSGIMAGSIPVAITGFSSGFTNSLLGVNDPYADFGNVLACYNQYLQTQFGIDQAIISAGGMNIALVQEGFGQAVDLERSFLKLHDPNRQKLGGGYRVKSITTTDNWGSMGGADASYTTNYSYTIEEAGQEVSSGVAAFEPAAISEENPLNKPWFYSNENLLAPDDLHFLDRPIGESFFPGPTVGYRTVKVEQEHPTNATRSATGYMEYAFYTAKDFPVRVKRSQPFPKMVNAEPDFDQRIIDFEDDINTEQYSLDLLGLSQGFRVIVNDMHGKPRSRKMVDEHEVTVSEISYSYKSEVRENGTYDLTNEVKLANPDGQIATGILGQSMEVFADNRVQDFDATSYMNVFGQNFSSGISVNVGISEGGVGAGIGHNFSVSFINNTTNSYQRRNTRTSVFTKLIEKHGLLDEVTVKNRHAVSKTRNLVYDGQTGQVLVTSSQNDYEDPVYAVSYPAHWAYEGMGAAYQNLGASFSDVDAVSGKLDITDATDFFIPGDELYISVGSSGYKAWVMKVDALGAVCVQENGALILDATNQNVKVIRSGHRNLLAASVGGATTLNDLTSNLFPAQVLNAWASEFSDEWQTYAAWDTSVDQISCTTVETCDKPVSPCGLEVGTVVNPYREGLRGNWKGKTSYAYQEDRLLASVVDPTDLRTDGQYDLTAFWNSSSNGLVKNSGASNFGKWISGGEVTLCSPFGMALESVDPLGIYSSALPGYNHTAIKAEAANARLKEIGYDGMEDYLMGGDNCNDRHFDFRDYVSDRTDTYAHTGRHSLQIAAGSSVTVERPLSVTDAPGTYWDAPYVLQDWDRIPTFSPEQQCKTQEYLVSCWVKLADHPGNLSTYADINLNVYLDCAVGTNTAVISRSPIIDGWQKIDAVFELPELYGIKMKFEVVNNSTSEVAYLDDFRVHPYLASMASYVYDEESMRVLAMLDDRNYATIFQYDKQGALVSTKVETERGIKTVSEMRGGLRKSN